MNFRIIIETEKSGIKRYYVQKRQWHLFWVYLTECRDISMNRYKISLNELKDAEQYIQDIINNNYAISQKKIIKREYLYR